MQTSQNFSGSSTDDVTPTPAEIHRHRCIDELARVSAELRAAKLEFGAVCRAGQRGRYLPPAQFHTLRLRVDKLKHRAQHLQAQIVAARDAAATPVPPDVSFEIAQARLARLAELRARNGA